MPSHLILFKTLACLTLFTIVLGATKLRNNTPNPITDVSVLHKYSSDYNHRGDWTVIPPGQVPNDTLTVEYNTGLLTTGKDWWMVTWYNQDKTRFFFSNPQNSRWLIDLAEGLFNPSADGLLSSESTTGFKQHILRDEDADEVTEIVIEADDQIEFRSKSGVSRTITSSTPVANDTVAGPRPFWAIAHRVLDKNGVEAALEHGANAIETDITAQKGEGWWADHDGNSRSKGDKMNDLLAAVADSRRAGKPISWVWFDLKNPDECGAEDASCNIEALRKLARETLEPVGVKVLWDFIGPDAKGRAFGVIRDDLNENEALGIDGLGSDLLGLNGITADDAKSIMEGGKPINLSQRVWTKGWALPNLKIGSCEDEAAMSSSNDICPQVRQAIKSKAFGKVFGWTVTKSNTQEANSLMEVGVDGLIYGFMATNYADDDESRAALKIVTDWLGAHKDRRYLATLEDKPW
ncbi:hypothetical protein CP533_0102 [Ophiocordyceps camponoti-saundersi (nom. inval.)]|nr:hypothetical protein CP533_0102 [Ophiocordyceps camponoti-saundersi (nom. inval.)]